MPYLDTYKGSWTAKEARHLLKRASFGISESLVNSTISLGLSKTIDTLFTVQDLPDPPVKYYPDGDNSDQIDDPGAKYGETWVHADPIPFTTSTEEQNRILRTRSNSLYAWSFLQMQNAEISIREKLTLFWHNHFVAENTNPHREYEYINLIRTHSLGNFKELTKQITIDTNMLKYLSGAINTDAAPNENYSRELLELFTIGKGNAVGNGDYTNYTEEDVVQMAKVLTGWRVRSLTHEDALIPFFSNDKHTKGDKKLSHRFGNAIISENGEEEYKDLIDKIFEQDECSRFITRKLYRWFVNSEITSEIETNIIEPLAKTIRDNNYEIIQALKILLASEHFFENTFCMMKSPIDLMFSTTKSLLFSAPTTTIQSEYEFAYVLYLATTDINQSMFHHPNVSGWKAYYQEPLFYKSWVNNLLLPKRLSYSKVIVTGGELVIDGINYTVPPLTPVLTITASINNSQDPNILIKALAEQLFNYEISQNQITTLKDILIPGLPDEEWTIEYSEYLSNPTNQPLAISVDKKLRDLISTMVQMSEFQIM
jgi:uncharacterized protein (DUF1800 family)